jgi:hypothetical protein
MMNKTIKILLFTTITALLNSCSIGAGTHGSLKRYEYLTTKDKLDSAIIFVIKNNPKIFRDTVGNKIIANVGNGKYDTIVDNSYNDGDRYVRIKIKTEKGACEYTFRYYGDEEHWKTATTSQIFITYAYDEQRKGGSEGNDEVDNKTIAHLTEVFEKEFVSNIDKKLNLTHIDTD